MGRSSLTGATYIKVDGIPKIVKHTFLEGVREVEKGVTEMKKSRIISIILESIATVSLFLPWCYLEKYFSHGTNTHTYNQNFFGGLSAGGGAISYIVLLLMVATIVLLAKGAVSQKKISLLEIVFPLIALISLAIAVFIRTDMLIKDPGSSSYAFWQFDMNWLLYIVFAMQIAITALTAIEKYFIKKGTQSC